MSIRDPVQQKNCIKLWAAVFHQAYIDAKKEWSLLDQHGNFNPKLHPQHTRITYRDTQGSIEWFFSESCESICQILDFSFERIKNKIMEF